MLDERGKYNRKMERGNKITVVVATVVIFAGLFMSIYFFLHMDFTLYDNEARLQLSDDVERIAQGDYGECFYPYVTYDLQGKILYSDVIVDNCGGYMTEDNTIKAEQIINVQEMMQTDKSFTKNYNHVLKETFVLKNQQVVNGFVTFFVPQRTLDKETNSMRTFRCFLPVGLGILFSVILFIYRIRYCDLRILKPIREIIISANSIINGNYDYEVTRIYGKNIGENEIGNLTFSFEMMRDELKEKQIREESLKKSQQELISCVSHDLKTPISTIKAYSEGIRDGIARTDQMKADYVEIIIGKTNLLITMIEELLEYSNAQLNKMDINKQELYFLDYFEEVMQEIEVYVRNRNIRFLYEANLENRIILLDAKRITEVFYNLIENSIKYSSSNPEIKIIATAANEEGKVLIRILDNGIGINADDIPYVFDKFYRAEKSRTSSIPGSGLGLSICKYIIEEHLGEIYCKSRTRGCEVGFII